MKSGKSICSEIREAYGVYSALLIIMPSIAFCCNENNLVFYFGKFHLQVLANGHIALTATLILNDDCIFKDGVGVQIEGEFIEAGTSGYDEFIDKLRKA